MLTLTLALGPTLMSSSTYINPNPNKFRLNPNPYPSRIANANPASAECVTAAPDHTSNSGRNPNIDAQVKSVKAFVDAHPECALTLILTIPSLGLDPSPDPNPRLVPQPIAMPHSSSHSKA